MKGLPTQRIGGERRHPPPLRRGPDPQAGLRRPRPGRSASTTTTWCGRRATRSVCPAARWSPPAAGAHRRRRCTTSASTRRSRASWTSRRSRIPRGGIRWTAGPRLRRHLRRLRVPVHRGRGDRRDGDQKTCCIVDCPPFEEIRADLIGLCVKAPLAHPGHLPGAGPAVHGGRPRRPPAQGQRLPHQHASRWPPGRPPSPPTWAPSRSACRPIGFAATGMRYRYRMGETQTIEVVAPWWLKALIKEDLGMRQMATRRLRRRVNKWFSDRNLSVQWVFDFQDPVVDRPATASSPPRPTSRCSCTRPGRGSRARST